METDLKTLFALIALVAITLSASIGFATPCDDPIFEDDIVCCYGAVNPHGTKVGLAVSASDLPSNWTALNSGSEGTVEDMVSEGLGSPNTGDKVIVFGITDPDWEWNCIVDNGITAYFANLGGAQSGDGKTYSVTDPNWEWN